jgi:uncharacterized DUF497 family protein
MINFIWDKNKSRLNTNKHKVTFEEAKSVFSDICALIINDIDHSQKEDRFIILGLSVKLRLLVVCHCYNDNDSVVRIISARKASKKEKEQYKRRLN